MRAQGVGPGQLIDERGHQRFAYRAGGGIEQGIHPGHPLGQHQPAGVGEPGGLQQSGEGCLVQRGRVQRGQGRDHRRIGRDRAECGRGADGCAQGGDEVR